jgi:hypothetical protein
MTEPKKPNDGELILYRTQEGAVRIEVLYESETFWLNQKKIAELFGVELPTISYHLKEIYDSGELRREATLRKIQRVQREGNREVRRDIEFYNLDAIISVGYRVNSAQATQFRIWATRTLREFVIKGFVLDDERLKLNRRFGKDYFDELLERIREIRASERRFYLKITDIYEQCSIDYDPHAEITQTFFNPHANGRLGRQARRLPEVQRIRGANQRRQRLYGSGQAVGRGAVCDVPRSARPAIRERF